MSWCKVKLRPGMDDAAIREKVGNASHLNGSYATYICRSCGIIRVDLEGDFKTADMVDSCKHCRADDVGEL